MEVSVLYEVLYYAGALFASSGGLYYLLSPIIFFAYWKECSGKNCTWLACKEEKGVSFLESWAVYWLIVSVLTSVGLAVSVVDGLGYNFNRPLYLLGGTWSLLHFTFLWFGIMLNFGAPKRPLLGQTFKPRGEQQAEASYARAARSWLPIYIPTAILMLITMFL